MEYSFVSTTATVTNDTNLLDVLHLMSSRQPQLSCVFVANDTELEGIFVDRDLMPLIVKGQSLADVKISEVMRTPAIGVRQSDLSDLTIPLQLLQQHQMQHLAVLDDRGGVVGVITSESLQPYLWDLLKTQQAQGSQHQEIEASLRKSEAQHQSLIKALPDLVMRMSGEGIYLDRASSSAFDLYCGDENLIGKSVYDSLSADLADLRLEYIQRALQTGKLQIYEQEIVVNSELRIEEVRITVCGDNEVLVIARDITDRKVAEEAFQTSEATNQAIIRAIPDLLIRVNRQGEHLTMLSGGAVKKVLLPSSNRENITVYDLLPHPLAVQRSQTIQQAFETGTLQTYEQQLELDGEMHWEEVRVSPLNDTEALVIIRDITVQKQSQLLLQQSEAKNRAILAAIPDLLVRVNAEGICLDVITPHRGFDLVSPESQVMGRSLTDLLPPDVAQLQLTTIQQALQTQELQIREQQIQVGDRLQYKEIRAVYCGEDEVLLMIRDISDRKQAEAALYELNQELEGRVEQRTVELRKSEAHLAAAQRIARLGSWEFNLKTWEIRWSQETYHIFGRSLNEANPTYEEFRQYIHPADVLQIERSIQSVFENGQPFECEYRLCCRDGEICYVLSRGELLLDGEGQAVSLVGTVLDITDRKLAEEALQQKEEALQLYIEELQVAEEELRLQMNELLQSQNLITQERFRYQDLFNSAPDAYIVTNASGIILEANHIATQLLNHSQSRLIGQQLGAFVLQSDRDRFRKHILELNSQLQARSQEFELQLWVGRSEPITVSIRVAVLCDPERDKILRWIVRDISREKQTAIQLQNLSDRLALAIRSGAMGIWEWDIVHNALIWDDRMYELYGIQRSDFGGAYDAWVNGVHPSDRPFADNAIQQALTGQKDFDIEFRVIHRDGSIHFIKAYGLVQRHLDGSPQRMIGVNFDITNRKQVEEQLHLMNQRLTLTNAELDRATRLKDEFLANMSHELRTPLNAILGMSEGLQESVFGPLNARQSKAINTIERSGKHLLELINDILDLSKIEAGKLDLETAPIAIHYLCESSLTFVRQQAVTKGIHLSLQGFPPLPDIVVDERRIRQVLINLLSNAIKFTPQGGQVQLTVQVEQQSQGNFLKLSVIDTGIGITQEDLAKLFQPFIQIDSSLNRQYTGTGLGLALVRRLTELHGGMVSVTSHVNQGSCFTICLPYITATALETPEIPTHQPLSLKTDNTRVLVIEDSSFAAEQISRYLQELELETIVCSSGDRAIDEAIRIQPSLILLDIQLPHLSGWDVLRQLKSSPQTQNIPVIVVSVVDERSYGLSLGALEYLVKPVNRQRLQSVLEKLKPFYQKSPSPDLSTTLPESVIEPQKSPLILLAEDHAINVTTISSYLNACGYRLVYAKNGREAVEMTQSHEPDLILMDIQMPDMDGLEAIRVLRSNPQFVNLPIIAITALAMPGDREKCLEAGATYYMSKPIRMKQLRELIQQALKQFSQ